MHGHNSFPINFINVYALEKYDCMDFEKDTNIKCSTVNNSPVNNSSVNNIQSFVKCRSTMLKYSKKADKSMPFHAETNCAVSPRSGANQTPITQYNSINNKMTNLPRGIPNYNNDCALISCLQILINLTTEKAKTNSSNDNDWLDFYKQYQGDETSRERATEKLAIHMRAICGPNSRIRTNLAKDGAEILIPFLSHYADTATFKSTRGYLLEKYINEGVTEVREKYFDHWDITISKQPNLNIYQRLTQSFSNLCTPEYHIQIKKLPKVLILKNRHLETECRFDIPQLLEFKNQKQAKIEYQLTGLIMHQPEHSYAIVREGDSFYHCDNASVNKMGPKVLEKFLNELDQPYFIIYEVKNKDQIPKIPPPSTNAFYKNPYRSEKFQSRIKNKSQIPIKHVLNINPQPHSRVPIINSKKCRPLSNEQRKREILRLTKLLENFDTYQSRKEEGQKEAVANSFNIELKNDIYLAPNNYQTLEIKLPDIGDKYLCFDSVSKNISDKNCYIAKSIVCAYNDKLIISNFTHNSIDLKSGTILGTASELKISNLPTDDTEFDFEKSEIIEKANAKWRRIETRTNPEMSHLQLFESNFGHLPDAFPPKRIALIKNKSQDTEELLPSQQFELDFKKALDNTDPEFRQLLIEYKSLFTVEDPGQKFSFMTIPPVELPIVSNHPEVIMPNYNKPMSPEERDHITKYIELGLMSGRIQRSTSTLVSPILHERKRSGKLRTVIDSRRINKSCIAPTSVVMPETEKILKEMCVFEIASVVDISGAFDRVPVAEKHRKYSAFRVNEPHEVKGVYEHTSLTQGSAASPAIFCSIMEECFKNTPSCVVAPYFDDVITKSTKKENHKSDLRIMFSRLKLYGCKLDINKCNIGKPYVEFLGLIIGQGQIKTCPERTKGLLELRCPDLSKDKEKPWLSLLHTLGYYRKFVSNFATYEAELREIQKTSLEKASDKDFLEAQTEKANRIILEVAEKIRSSVLVSPPPQSEIMLHCDASTSACAFVLSMKNKRPIFFGSHKFSKIERGYTIFEKELYAIRYALKKAGAYIMLSKSTRVYCDNLATVINLNSLEPVTSCPRAVRIIMDIQMLIFNCKQLDVEFLPTLKNIVADQLSRLSSDPCDPAGEKSLFAVTRGQSAFVKKLEQWHKQSHMSYRKLMDIAIESGEQCPSNLRALATAVVDNCDICRAEAKVICKTFLGITDTPERELQWLCVDHLHMTRSRSNNKYCLTVLDPFSKFAAAIPTRSLEMDEASRALSSILSVWPDVEQVKADNAFDSSLFKEMLKSHDVTPKFTASHNSRSNNVERTHVDLRRLSERFSIENGRDYNDDWEYGVQSALKSINSTPSSVTGFSPYLLIYGTSPNLLNKQPLNERKRINRRKLVRERIIEAKKKYSKEEGAIEPIPIGEICRIRYNNKAAFFDVEIVEDEGLTVVGKRIDNGQKLRYAKRHVRRLRDRQHV